MEQYIYNEGNGLWYERSGDYYLPYWKQLQYKSHQQKQQTIPSCRQRQSGGYYDCRGRYVPCGTANV